VDEDEENYGDYQSARMGEENHDKVWEWDVSELKENEHDEYTSAVWCARKYISRERMDRIDD
jgi:hypothetical protein